MQRSLSPRKQPESLAAVAATGDRRAVLEALRQHLADAIDANPPARDLAALARQMSAVLTELDEMPVAEERSTVNDLTARRAARRAAAGL